MEAFLSQTENTQTISELSHVINTDDWKMSYQHNRKREINQFKSAHTSSAKPNRLDSSSTGYLSTNDSSTMIKTFTISTAYSSQNEGNPWWQKSKNKQHGSALTKIPEIEEPNKHIENGCEIQNLVRVLIAYNNWIKSKDSDFIDTLKIMEILNNYVYVLHHINGGNKTRIFATKFGNCTEFDCEIFNRNSRNRLCYSSMPSLTTLYDNTNFHTIVYLQILDTIHCYFHHNYEENNYAHSKTEATNNLQKILSSQLQTHKISVSRQYKYNQLVPPANGKHMYCFGCEFCYDGTGEEEKSDTVVVMPKYLSKKTNIANASLSSIQFDLEWEKASRYFDCMYRKEHYSNISMHYLLSLMIYCDYDVLQNEFSKTYRDACGHKHNNFYHWGKYLKQVVHQFGTRMCDGKVTNLYHGIGEKLSFPQIIGNKGIGVKIFCPLSTSSSLSVASNFTNAANGFVIEFGGSSRATYFSVSWLSDYAHESEYLFIQNEYQLQITNIMDPLFGFQYMDIIKSLNVIDQIVSEQYLEANIPSCMEQLRLNHPQHNAYKSFDSLDEYA
eukprot:38311_1